MTKIRKLKRIEIRPKYLIFLGEEQKDKHAKTGHGILHWRPELCVGQLRLPACKVDLGLPDMTPAEAAGAGARSFIWGVAGFGGVIPPEWTGEWTFQVKDADGNVAFETTFTVGGG